MNTLLPPPQSDEADFDPALLTRGPIPLTHSLGMGPLHPLECHVTSADSISLILRRLDEHDDCAKIFLRFTTSKSRVTRP